MNIYNYEAPLKKYFDEKIKISNEIKSKLKSNCESNEDRVINGLDEKYKITRASFVQQGSYAMQTIIQAENNEYDIDDAIIFDSSLLKNRNGNDLSANELKNLVLEAVKDERFVRAPEKLKNCVRIYYNEGHHVDMACLRKETDFFGDETIELASSDWKASNPQQINEWFKGKIESLNREKTDSGSRLRRMIRFLKRFSKSRPSWNMPCGLILTMLTVECFKNYDRDDECFYYLMKELSNRFNNDGLVVKNLADNSLWDKETLTKTSSDPSMIELRDKIKDVLDGLSILEKVECNSKDAREAWDNVFKTDGFLNEDWDDVVDKMNIIRSGKAKTSSWGTIGFSGLSNIAHKFHGV